MTSAGFEPIAIIGQSCVLPGALDPEALFANLLAGNDLLESVTAGRWRVPKERVYTTERAYVDDTTFCDRGGYVADFDARFDASSFGLDIERVRALDPLTQWSLYAAREALVSAGCAARAGALARTGAVVGNLSYPSSSLSQFAEAVWLEQAGTLGQVLDIARPAAENRFMSGWPVLLTAQALGLGLGGVALDAACSSSLYAIKLACDALHDGRADMMLAGGVNRADDLFIHIGFCALLAMSKSGQSRPFHRDADGLVPAEGAALVLLKRLDDALRDGDPVLGVIRGIGLSNDGKNGGLLAPSADGQERALRLAYAQSGLAPTDISYVECHATGTQVGDLVEIESMRRVFSGRATKLAVGSLKSNLGHLITASGVAGLQKILGAFRHHTLPATIHLDAPLAELAGTPLRVITASEPWDAPAPRRAGVNNFGFGGNNAHLIVEEWCPPVRPRPSSSAVPAAIPQTHTSAPIAVIDVQVLAADCEDTPAFVRALCGGEVHLRPRPDGTVCGYADHVDLPLTGLRYPPSDLDETLAQQLLILRAALAAAENAGPWPSDRTGVWIGMQCDAEVGRYGARLRVPGFADVLAERLGRPIPTDWIARARAGAGALRRSAGVVGAMPNIVANRISCQFDLRGPSFTVSQEEGSGLAALALACRALTAGEVDVALAGAVDICAEPVHEAAMATASADAPSLRRPSGDAAVLLTLKRVDAAKRDGDAVLALITDAALEQRPPSSELAPVDFAMGDQGLSLVPQFGHSHAASGLMHVAAAALACQHQALPRGAKQIAVPRLAQDPPCAAEVTTQLLDGTARRVRVQAAPALPPGGRSVFVGEALPELFIYAAGTAHGVRAHLEQGDATHDAGAARLVIVARSSAERAQREARARELLAHDPRRINEPGIYYCAQPIVGELAFVFTGPAGVYPAMGRELCLGLPELVDRLRARCRGLADFAGWIFADDSARPSAEDQLWGSSFLSQLHGVLSQEVLGLRPAATIGFCSGETNALFALGAWSDLDGFAHALKAAQVFSRNIAGPCDVAREAWTAAGCPLAADEPVDWVNYRVLAPAVEVARLVDGEPRVHLTIISAPDDVVLGGARADCLRVVQELGRSRAFPLGYDAAIHCGEVRPFAPTWRALHHRETHPVDGVRFYSAASGRAYSPTADAAADALTGMALDCFDFPKVVRAAHDDGVRIFIEHGPRDGCSRWIRKILGDAEHLSIGLDRAGTSSLEQAVHVVAALDASGQSAPRHALLSRLGARARRQAAPFANRPLRRYPAHPAPVCLPPFAAKIERPETVAPERMVPAPQLPSVLDSMRPLTTAMPAGPASDARISGASDPSAPSLTYAVDSHPNAPCTGRSGRALRATPARARPQAPNRNLALRLHDQLAATHAAFLATQSALHQEFLATRTHVLSLGTQVVARAPKGPRRAPVFPRQRAVLDSSIPGAAALKADQHAPSGPRFSRAAVEILGSGRIADVFGPAFAFQDDFERQVRLPEGRLLLVDRILGIRGDPLSMGQGTIWTETDVRWDGWYLNDDGTMPAGIVVESGQADLTLISWLGIDQHNRGERVYRLLGCELSNHGTLPRPGETLRYEIHVDGHAKLGGVRLFFFHYDCRVNGELRLKVRNGQAGFFTDEELKNSGGVLWSPDSAPPTPEARVDAPAVPCTRRAFSTAQVQAFSVGKTFECFGPGFELTQTHIRTPKIQSDDMLLLDEVECFEPRGGPWGRGYLRVRNQRPGDRWYMPGHFKNDPCMPGTLMCEGCLQAMAFFLTGMGHTIQRDGWRFDPVPDETYKLQCRGQVVPGARELTYEVFVEELHDGPIPLIFADILGTCDGLKIFHGRRMGLRLIPDWPMTSMPELLSGYVEPKPVAMEGDFAFDYRSLLSCAWGRPSEAFGAMAAPFDGTRHIARLPGPPYHFMSRVTKIDGAIGSMKTGAKIELEYDIPKDAWYFEQNARPAMPYCVLLEAVLQPCGWLAVYIGCPGAAPVDVCFRNLDGSGRVLGELGPDSGTLCTRTTLTSISKMGDIILTSFEVSAAVAGKPVYELKTSFGFFPQAALAAQVGLPVNDDERALLAAASDTCVDLTTRPARYFAGALRLPGPMLLMLDRVSGYWKDQGRAGRGRLRAEKDVTPAEWFFKAHFFQDPVQPGSLGLEAMIQLLQFYVIHERLADELIAPRFEPLAAGETFTWKYRGQVTPDKQRVTVTVDIQELSEQPDGLLLVAASSLYCDGLRIYHTDNLPLRVVGERRPRALPLPATDASVEAQPDAALALTATPTSARVAASEEVLDPAVDRWVNDHRPNWTLPTLPLMSMLDRLAQATVSAAGPAHSLCVIQAEDVRVSGWLVLDQPRRLRSCATELPATVDAAVSYRAELAVFREAARRELTRFEPVASGVFRLAEHYPPPPPLLPPLEDAAPADNPYRVGALFHGSAFQLLESLWVGAKGSRALLCAEAPEVPFGLLNQALLDAAVHGVIHDELCRWSADIPERHIAYPYRVVRASFYGPPPTHGRVRCETRFIGFDDSLARDSQRFFPRFHIQLSQDDALWLDLELAEVLIPMGPHADDRDKRIAFRDRKFVRGAGISRLSDEETRLCRADVKSRDWLPGSVAYAYRSKHTGGTAQELVELSIKDHVAQRAGCHPAFVDGDAEQGFAVSATEPLTRYPVHVRQAGDDVVVRSAGEPTLDVARLRAFGRKVTGLASGWVGEDLSLGLAQRFVKNLHVAAPDAWAEVASRPLLLLGNHQVQIESMICPTVISALTAVHVLTVGKQEHRDGWIGPLSEFTHRCPGVSYPRMISYFDQQDPGSMFTVLNELRDAVRREQQSVFVHVEGELGHSCRDKVTKLSSVFVDLALELSLPIVPVRLTGGLPVAPLAHTLDFPLGYARQDYWLGTPLLPEALVELDYAARRKRVFEAINDTGPAWERDHPAPADPQFSAEVRARQQRFGITEVAAVVLAVLEELERPSAQTSRLLAAIRAGRLSIGDSADERWLASAARWLVPTISVVRDY